MRANHPRHRAPVAMVVCTGFYSGAARGNYTQRKRKKGPAPPARCCYAFKQSGARHARRAPLFYQPARAKRAGVGREGCATRFSTTPPAPHSCFRGREPDGAAARPRLRGVESSRTARPSSAAVAGQRRRRQKSRRPKGRPGEAFLRNLHVCEKCPPPSPEAGSRQSTCSRWCSRRRR